jgi:hypothetical protein
MSKPFSIFHFPSSISEMESRRQVTPPDTTSRQQSSEANEVNGDCVVTAPALDDAMPTLGLGFTSAGAFRSIESAPAVAPSGLPASGFFEASVIAAAINTSKKTVHRRAKAESWPRKLDGNQYLYQPPINVLCRIAVKREDSQLATCHAPLVTFDQIAHDPEQVTKVNRRKKAVEFCLANRHLGKESALAHTIVHIKDLYPNFSISVDSLRTWVKRYEQFGLNGLVEQKRGVVGRKGVEVPAEFAALGKALTAEYGSAARAARDLMMHPELPADMRKVLHGGHPSKSYITPTVRAAITPSAGAVDLLQGPRHARLNGRFTPTDSSDYFAGDFFVSDDMTDNGICWCEWPNARGFRIGQAQLLPILDVRTLRWLCFRLVLRESGQYNSDDVWGLFGDLFDKFGLPKRGFVLEGNIWQANKVIGTRTGLGDDERIGGLESLGLEMRRSYDPRTKIIEEAFNQLQYQADRAIGYTGRDQRKQLPEKVKAQIAAVNSGRAHPREFFPHISQRADHYKQAMEFLNQERQDGEHLRGKSPLELWAEHNPRLNCIPDQAKWLYRSAMSMVKVTRNGVRITRGSGANMEVFYYDNPALFEPMRQSKFSPTVIVHWDDYNPDTDVCIRDLKTRQFIGVAKRVHPLSRFDATDEQLQSERQRKQAALHCSRTEIRTMQQHLVRSAKPIAVDAKAADIGQRIAAARNRCLEAEARKSTVRKIVERQKVNIHELDAAPPSPTLPESETPSRIPETTPDDGQLTASDMNDLK